MNEFRILHRSIGPNVPVYIIAELSANHGKSFERAAELIRVAHQAGADAVKLQTYTPDTITIDCDNPYFQIKHDTIWDGQNLYRLYGEAYTPWDWQPKLKAIANDLGMDLFSTPFDDSAVDFLEAMDVPAYKVASFELVDRALLTKIAQTRKPVIMSTGMASLAEIEEAVRVLRENGCAQLCLLKCTSAYPSPPESMNLATIPHLSQAFDVPVGLSDHTLGTTVPVTAVALGACVIEKHFTLDRNETGPDSAFSLEPDEFRAMVDSIRIAEKAIGRVHYGGTADDKANRAFRRSLFIVADVRAGDMLTQENVRSIRPGYGLEPKHLESVIGRPAKTDLPRGTPLKWQHVA